MSVRDCAGVLLFLTALGAGAEQRPPSTAVSVVRIANYGAPSVMVEREHGTKRLGEYRVSAEHVVERPVQKGQFAYCLAIDRAGLPRIGKLLAEILPAKDCN